MAADAGSDLSDLGSVLGSRLCGRRRELGLTLGEVARSADVSKGYLSSIENGAGVPSLPVLARLAHALGFSLAEVLRTTASPKLARGRVGEALGTMQLAASGSRLEIAQVTGGPGEAGHAPFELGGRDVFVFVQRGQLEVDVDGETFGLGPGDALHCDLPTRLAWRAAGDERAVALWAAGRTPSPVAQ